MSIYRAQLSKAAKTVGNYYYHSEHKHQAGQLIESMTSLAGGRRSPALFKQCDEYAKNVLGSIKYSPWLKAYTVFSGEFKEGWIPDNYYGGVVVPKLGGDYGEMSNCKAVSRRLFQTDLLPDLAYSVNGLLYTPEMELISTWRAKEISI